jgi:hypothetical protein
MIVIVGIASQRRNLSLRMSVLRAKRLPFRGAAVAALPLDWLSTAARSSETRVPNGVPLRSLPPPPAAERAAGVTQSARGTATIAASRARGWRAGCS